MRRPDAKLTDCERILLHVIHGLATTNASVPKLDTCAEGACWHVHLRHRPPCAGELMYCRTGAPSRWKVAWFVAPGPEYGSAVLREIGGTRLCNMSNEDFLVVTGLHASQLLEGDEHQFREKVIRAFDHRDIPYDRCFGGVEFLPDCMARIWVRQMFPGSYGPSVPFAVSMPWRRKTSILLIQEVLFGSGLIMTRSLKPEGFQGDGRTCPNCGSQIVWNAEAYDPFADVPPRYTVMADLKDGKPHQCKTEVYRVQEEGESPARG